MMRPARYYQAICVLTAAAVLLCVVVPTHLRLSSSKGSLVPQAGQVHDLGELDSFAMSLLLGGFRGPLVMYLWITSEEEKNRDETEKFMTRMELIGELQPQFSSVYIFQSWNLAYNISVQYSRQSEKYRWVTAGIEFAEKGERRIPENTDVLTQLGHIYFDKLGESFDREYYRGRFRRESLERLLDREHHLQPAHARRWQYIDRLEELLAEIDRARQETGKTAVPARLPQRDRTAPRHRWPYGVSVFAIAFDYFQQATLYGRHSQFGEVVISGRPAIACRAWLREELGLAMSAESRLWPMSQLGQALPEPTAATVLDGEGGPAPALAEALFHCREARAVARLARAGYLAHLANYPDQSDIYVTHLNAVAIKAMMAEAGEGRLTGIVELVAAENPQQARAARQKLTDARVGYVNAVRLTEDFVATEYRVDPWSGGGSRLGRERYDRWADQARRAVDQIDRLLR